jgi:hypothetical protein
LKNSILQRRNLFFFSLLWVFSTTVLAQDTTIFKKTNTSFDIGISEHGINALSCVADEFKTNYIRRGRVFGDMMITYRYGSKIDSIKAQDATSVVFSDHQDQQMLRQQMNKKGPLQLVQQFSLKGDSLVWSFEVRNTGSEKVVIEDWAIPFFFNSRGGENPQQIFEQRVSKHSFIAGAGSFVFWQRPSGVGPYLLMTPTYGSEPEYFNQSRFGRDQGVYQIFLFASKTAGERVDRWNQTISSLELVPGQTFKGGFQFRWARDYAHMRELLYEHGGFDIRVVPGMSVPRNLPIRVAIRTKHSIDSFSSARPSVVKKLSQNKGYQIYEVSFRHLGEQRLSVYSKGKRKTQLDFFITEPLDSLYKKRARFIATKQQHRDTTKWYNGLFSQWDMREAVLRGPDNTDGIGGRLSYVWACDDPGLCKAPFVAAKNAIYPDTTEINAIEYYIKHFVWGKLQRTDTETPYPYGIYGTPNWFVNRNAELRRQNRTDQNQDKMHVWRSYDYPHIMMMYYHMYQIASWYPDKVKYLDKAGYLKRAVETAKAYFKYPYEILPWYETYKWGCYNELLLMDLMKAMKKEGGYDADISFLKSEWEKKVKYFIYDDRYPFRSEYAVDATAFETTHIIAKYALENKLLPDSNLWYDKNLKKWYSHPVIDTQQQRSFMERQMLANLASRGWLEPAYYYMGSDFRGSNDRYLLSYMAQMGGWSVLDYGLNYAKDYSDYLQLGYASYLSSFALINTGDAESNYGYWFPGKENDGAAGWAYEPMLYANIWIGKQQLRGPWMYDGEIDLGFGGALRTAATVLVNDKIFGWTTLGGTMKEQSGVWSITPLDGIRQKIYVKDEQTQIEIQLEQDGFQANVPVQINKNGFISFAIENRASKSHTTTVFMKGLPDGRYQIKNGKRPIQTVNIKGSELTMIPLMIQNQFENFELKRM